MKKIVFSLLVLLVMPLMVSGASVDVPSADMSLNIPDEWYVFTRENIENNPDLDELDLTVNTYDDLKNITCSSQKKISWICKKNHKYIQSVVNKVKGKGCPICNNKQVLQGFNDLVTWCKYNNCTEILDDWDYELNDFLPEEVTYGSNKMCNFAFKTIYN